MNAVWANGLFLGTASLVAISAGFLLVPPEQAGAAVRALGVGFITLLSGIWVSVFSRALLAGRSPVPWHSRSVIIGLAVALVGVIGVRLFSEPVFRVQFDEVMLLGTAQGIFLEGEPVVPVRALVVGDEILVQETLLDKRPWLFSSLVAGLHAVTGFRLEQGFLLNHLLAFILFFVCFRWAERVGGTVSSGILAVILVSGIPLVGLGLTSAGFELLNLLVITGSLAQLHLYLASPDRRRHTALVMTLCLLAYCRYESIALSLLLLTTVFIVDIRREGWRRALRPVYGIVPLAFVPYAWLMRSFSGLAQTFQVEDRDAESVFHLAHLPGNLWEAAVFFLDMGWSQPNSPVLVLAAAGAIAGVLHAFRRPDDGRPGPDRHILLLAGLMAGFSLFLLSYFWAQFTDPVTRRISLPVHLVFVLIILASLPVLKGFPRAIPLLVLFVCAGWAGHTAPTLLQRGPGPELPFARAEWNKLQWVRDNLDSDALVLDFSPVQYYLDRRPAVRLSDFVLKADAFRFHFHKNTWNSWIVFAGQRRESPGDPWIQDPRYPDLGKLLVLEARTSLPVNPRYQLVVYDVKGWRE